MIFKFIKSFFILLTFVFTHAHNLFSQNLETITINTTQGHVIKKRASGFNVRIADKEWNYTHPDFIKTVHELKPGWLRYFSGTMGDAFSSATGQYDLDYIAMFDHPKQYIKGHHFTEIKGPNRITDLYQLLSTVNGKLIVTVNAFSESPKMILELARFCKNNNIKVEVWQFCNEPYFYVPNRNRYWWNDGYDYAAKMKPYAEAIQQIFPDAKLTLNFTWDGVWTFMKEIHKYQKENGAYWNVFSKHSYAPHTGKKESLKQAYKRANTKLIEATSANAMQQIEKYTEENIPMIITEFGVWNRPLNGIYSSIYNIEYVMRQLEHTNTKYVGAHEVSSKYTPLNNKRKIIEDAFKNNNKINTDTLLTGIRRDLEGKAYSIYHEATNNSEFLYNTKISNSAKVPGLKNTKANGMFAQTYKGNNGFNYLVVTNRSSESKRFQITIDKINLDQPISTTYISADSLQVKDAKIENTVFKNGIITVKPFSVSVHKWKTNSYQLEQPTIYKATVKKQGVLLKWSAIENASTYKIYYGTNISNLNKTVSVTKGNSFLVKDLKLNENYFFKIEAKNENLVSKLSDPIITGYKTPKAPKIFKAARRDNAVTLFWKSVPNVTSYVINYVDENQQKIEIDTDNVFGYKIKNLKNNTNYQFSVTGYNGLGKGISSEKETVFVADRVPLSPRNVSAIKEKNTIVVKWIPQKKVLENTCYNVYRGEKLHQFSKVANCIKDTIYVDKATDANKQYYYTVKAQTEVGESNFHPNIATAFSVGNNNKIRIQVVQKQKEGYIVKVELNQIKVTPKDAVGVIINNVSYLNVEHIQIFGKPDKEKQNSFQVLIPMAKVKENSNYAIKAFIVKNGKQIESAIVNQYTDKK